MRAKGSRSGTERRCRRWAAAVVLLLAWDAAPLAAQRVEGRLRDADTEAAIAGATLALLDDAGTVVHSAVSGVAGEFSLRAPRAGVYRIRASRLGYRDATSGPVDLVGNAEVWVEMRLSTRTVVLEPVTVTAQPRYARLQRAGFYQREAEFGPEGLHEAHFLDQREIEAKNPFSVVDLLKDLPGVYPQRGGLSMRRGCQPAIVIDGFTTVRANGQRGGSGRMIESPASLVGVEVYYGMAIPARYLLDAGGCGVILFWTK